MDKEPLIDSQPSTPDTCTKAVENPLVLQKILEKVEDSSDLLCCRLVSSTWRDLATELLLQKSDIRINFKYDDTSKTYRKVQAESETVTKEVGPTLKELIRLIETENENQSQNQNQDQFRRNSNSTTNSNSTSTSQCRFPCGFFQFKGGELSHPEVQEFLSLHGENIHGLYLLDFLVTSSDTSSSSLLSSSLSTSMPTSTSQSTCDLDLCKNLLWKKVPHLHTLYLNIGQFVQFLPCSLIHSETEKEKVLTLPNLHTLGIYPMSWPQWHDGVDPLLDFLKEIIVDIAVNLQSVYFVSSHPSSSSTSSSSLSNDNLPLGLLTWFQEMKKLHLVKSFGFLIHFDPDYTEELDKISMYENLNLKELTIGDARSLLVYSRHSRNSSHHAITSELIESIPIPLQIQSERVHSLDLCQSLGRILWSSRSSIETLTIGNCFYEDLLPGVPFPQGGLINVKKLVLNHVNRKEKMQTNYYDISDDGIGTVNIHSIDIGLDRFDHRPRKSKSPFYHQVPNVEEVIIDYKTLWHRNVNGNINHLPAQVFMSPQSLEDVRLFRSDPQKLEDSLELELYAVKERSEERKRRKRLHFIIVFTFSIISLILLSVYAMYMRERRKGQSRGGGVNKPICKSICTHNEIDSFFQ